jgi:hypothetical protein
MQLLQLESVLSYRIYWLLKQQALAGCSPVCPQRQSARKGRALGRLCGRQHRSIIETVVQQPMGVSPPEATRRIIVCGKWQCHIITG